MSTHPTNAVRPGCNVVSMADHRCDKEFGGCPNCGSSHGYFNRGRQQWFYCRVHRVCWLVGENLFSSWRDETAEDHAATAEMFSGYRAVRGYQ